MSPNSDIYIHQILVNLISYVKSCQSALLTKRNLNFHLIHVFIHNLEYIQKLNVVLSILTKFGMVYSLINVKLKN